MKGDLFIATFVINKMTDELEEYSVMHAVNAKKEPAAFLPAGGQEMSAPLTDSGISIANLLNVNQYFPDILPESVLRRFGWDSRPKGNLGKTAPYLPAGCRAVNGLVPRALFMVVFN